MNPRQTLYEYKDKCSDIGDGKGFLRDIKRSFSIPETVSLYYFPPDTLEFFTSDVELIGIKRIDKRIRISFSVPYDRRNPATHDIVLYPEYPHGYCMTPGGIFIAQVGNLTSYSMCYNLLLKK